MLPRMSERMFHWLIVVALPIGLHLLPLFALILAVHEIARDMPVFCAVLTPGSKRRAKNKLGVLIQRSM